MFEEVLSCRAVDMAVVSEVQPSLEGAVSMGIPMYISTAAVASPPARVLTSRSAPAVDPGWSSRIYPDTFSAPYP